MNPNPKSPLDLHFDESGGERHATWLELFFDLVFVFAIAQLAHLLHSDLSWGGFVGFVALFVPVWWLWIDYSYYVDQFNISQTRYRLIMFCVMFGLLILALTLPNALHGGSAKFAAIYSVLRLVIILLYLQAWRVSYQTRELTSRYIISFSIAFFFWLTSIIVPEPVRFVLWAIALFIEIFNGPIAHLTVKSLPAQESHMDERFGLFVIIVLGEAVIAVAQGVSELDWRWQVTWSAISGFVIAVSFWWMYFERSDDSFINQALRGGKQALLKSYIYGYSHFLVFVGIVSVGVGVQAGIEAVAANSLHLQSSIEVVAEHSGDLQERIPLLVGSAIFLWGLSLVQWASPRSLPNQLFAARSLLSVGYLAILFFGQSIDSLVLLTLMLFSIVALVNFESRYLR